MIQLIIFFIHLILIKINHLEIFINFVDLFYLLITIIDIFSSKKLCIKKILTNKI